MARNRDGIFRSAADEIGASGLVYRSTGEMLSLHNPAAADCQVMFRLYHPERKGCQREVKHLVEPRLDNLVVASAPLHQVMSS